jgi:hypothetical protein
VLYRPPLLFVVESIEDVYPILQMCSALSYRGVMLDLFNVVVGGSDGFFTDVHH